MIIKSDRHATASSRRRVIDHLLRGDENQYVEILQGSELDLEDFWRDARTHKTVKALRTWIVSPHDATSREQVFEVLAALALEFGFQAARATVVEHGKARATADALDRHWHIAIGEVDPVSGRVLSSSYDHARHELVARVCEFRWGHTFVLGAHTKAVLARLRRDGHTAVADALDRAFSPAVPAEKPQEGFTTPQHQAWRRVGLDLAMIRQTVFAGWSSFASLSELTALLAEQGVPLRPGDKLGHWILAPPGVEPVSLQRLIKVPRSAFAARMKELTDADDTRAHDGTDGAKPAQRGYDRGGKIGPDPGGDRGPSGVRRNAGSENAGRDQLPGPDREPPEHAVRGHGDHPRLPQDAPRVARRSEVPGGHEGRVPGGLKASLLALTATVATLLTRTKALAEPPDVAVRRLLDSHAAEERRKAKLPPVAPDRAELDRVIAVARSRIAAVDSLDDRLRSLTSQIGPLVTARRGRDKSRWRWFRAMVDDDLDRLRAEREQVQTERRRAEVPMRIAIGHQRRAEEAFADAVALSERSHERELERAEARLAAIARARRLVAAWPAFVHMGIRWLIGNGGRVNRLKARGWDPGPSAGPAVK